MGKRKIDDIKLKRLIREGMTIKHCAQHFGCSVAAVHHRLKAMQVVVSKSMTMNPKRVAKVADESFDAVEKLKRINRSAMEMLVKLEGVQSGKIALEELAPLLSGKTSVAEAQCKVLAEIRKQLALSHDVYKSLYDMRQVQKFQTVVIEELRNADPALAKRVVDRLALRSVLSSSLALT